MPNLPATLIKTGPEALIRPIIEALGIQKIVDRLCPMERPNGITHGQAIEVLVYNRLLDPSPLCHVSAWFQNAGMEQVLGFAADKLNDDRLARALDAVAYANQDIHTAATLQAVSAFDLDTRLIHHDTTSFYFTGDYDEQEWITFGYSRDKRPDTRQMNLALTINGDGVPLDHSLMPGNENDVTGMKARLDALRGRLPEGSRLVVTDRRLHAQIAKLARILHAADTRAASASVSLIAASKKPANGPASKGGCCSPGRCQPHALTGNHPRFLVVDDSRRLASIMIRFQATKLRDGG